MDFNFLYISPYRLFHHISLIGGGLHEYVFEYSLCITMSTLHALL